MLHLDIRFYARLFRQPLRTAHGPWKRRTGIILRFENERGQVWFGEVVPLPWFGTETLEAAQTFLEAWPCQFARERSADVPDTLPCCQFGLGASFKPANVDQPSIGKAFQDSDSLDHADFCALLPTGTAALDSVPALWTRGHRTFKWKIGVAPVDEELAIFVELLTVLPGGAQLRLDANGGLTSSEAERWLAACDRASPAVEFLEQPLPPHSILDWVLAISDRFSTRIAVDESVATLLQLRQVYQKLGNRVIYVIKPAIAGFPEQLLSFCSQNRLEVAFSSALETPVGKTAALAIAHRSWAAGVAKRALGFGVSHWFADDWNKLSQEELWQRL